MGGCTSLKRISLQLSSEPSDNSLASDCLKEFTPSNRSRYSKTVYPPCIDRVWSLPCMRPLTLMIDDRYGVWFRLISMREDCI